MPRVHAGYTGMFTRHQYDGAITNGTRVVKIQSEAGDAHPVGSLATVLGSVGHPGIGIGYFVEWDDQPRMAVFVAGVKIERAKELG